MTAIPVRMGIFLWLLFVGSLTIPAYVVAITTAWLLFKRQLRSGLALTFAIATVALTGVVLPIYGNWETTRRFDAVTRTNFLPSKRIAITGNIRLDNVGPTEWERWVSGTKARGFTPDERIEASRNWDPGMCGDTCRGLLRTPGIASVTVDPVPSGIREQPSPHAATFRSSTAPCAPGNPCLTRIPTVSSFDFHVTRSAGPTFNKAYKTGQSGIETRLLPRTLDIEGLEIRDALDRLLLRQTWATFRLVKQPIMLEWSLSPYSPHVGFAATIHHNQVTLEPFWRWTTVPLKRMMN